MDGATQSILILMFFGLEHGFRIAAARRPE
jgi:hypothetical protein